MANAIEASQPPGFSVVSGPQPSCSLPSLLVLVASCAVWIYLGPAGLEGFLRQEVLNNCYASCSTESGWGLAGPSRGQQSKEGSSS